MSATPQLEDGFVRIANELLEAVLAFKFTHREVLVLLTIIRKTYGYGKKTDDISASQIGDMCNIARQHVTSTLNSLAMRNVITKKPGRFGSIIGVQKNHKKWVTEEQISATEASPKSGQGCPKSGLVPNRDASSPKSGQVDSPKSGHTKDNLPKDNPTKKGARQEVTFTAWLSNCQQESRTPIPEDDPIFAYAEEMGLQIDFVRYAWIEFKRKYGNSGKRYKNWNQHFQNAVRENWYGIWFERDGQWHLTTRGKQIEIEINRKAA
jgi:phage replication O-like protein O